MIIIKKDLFDGISSLNLDNQVICIHGSLKSFGHVHGGARTIIDSFPEKGCTLLAPGFIYENAIPPPMDDRPQRNGVMYEEISDRMVNDKIFTMDCNDISAKDLGAIPYEMLLTPARVRGYHPINSFTAIGPKAVDLVVGQTEKEVYDPLKRLYDMNGYVLLMGVDLTKMTAIHYAEQKSGRNLFIQWARGMNGIPIRVSVGSCSEGFNNFSSALAEAKTTMYVGKSQWQLFHMRKVIDICTAAIKENPQITHCHDIHCQRCNDAVQGGPIV